MLGTSIAGNMFSAHGTFFYTEIHGLSLLSISFGTILYTIWDAVNDPLFGWLSDRTRTRLGRRKPWLLAGAPLYLLAFIFFFSPPGSVAKSAMPLAIYYTAFLMLTETMSTVNSTNYHSQFSELFKTEKERTRTNALRQGFQIVGIIFGMALVPMLAENFGWQPVAVVLGTIGMALLMYAALGCHEDPAHIDQSAPGFFESVRSVIKNRNFWAVGLTHMFYDATVAIAAIAIPYFVKYALNEGGLATTLLSASVFVVAIPFMAVWAWVISRKGAIWSWRAALAFIGCAFIPMIFVNGLIPSVVSGSFIGIGFAGVTASLDLIQSRVMDEDTRVTGKHREGFLFSSLGFLRRLSGLMKSLIFFLVVMLFGFHNADNPGAHPDQASRAMLAIFPVVLMVFSFGASFFARFDKDTALKA